MKRLWTSYLKKREAFSFSINIPIDISNYESKILEFDSFFLRRGFHWDIYKIVSVSDNTPLEVDKLIDTYVSSKQKSFFDPEFPFISLLRWTDWGLYDEKIRLSKEWDLVMTIPTKDEVWGSIDFSISDYNKNETFQIWTTYTDGPLLDELEKGEQKNVGVLIESNANIWYEAFEITTIKEEGSPKYRPVIFDKPVDNRAIAYRVSPRFNSFWRDIKNKVIEMSGTVEVDTATYGFGEGFVNEEGYILLDGKVVFQEDIDNGLVALPD